MNRLPIKFEEEVLSGRGIAWLDWAEMYAVTPLLLGPLINGTHKLKSGSSNYEIAAIALESLLKNRYENNIRYCDVSKKFLFNIGEIEENSDFCECIFKAINEIYGDKK